MFLFIKDTFYPMKIILRLGFIYIVKFDAFYKSLIVNKMPNF